MEDKYICSMSTEVRKMKKFNLEDKVIEGLEHCVEDCFFCVGCPYKPLESSQFPLRCVHALLTDIQKLRKENKQ